MDPLRIAMDELMGTLFNVFIDGIAPMPIL
jgi:hypothetical protein